MGNDHRGWNYCGSSNHVVRLNLAIMVGCLACYGLNQYVVKPAFDFVVFRSYFNDFLAAMMLPAVANLVIISSPMRSWLIITPIRIFLTVAAAGFFWEYVTPIYRKSSVCDTADLIAYLAGGALYLGLIVAAGGCFQKDRSRTA